MELALNQKRGREAEEAMMLRTQAVHQNLEELGKFFETSHPNRNKIY